MNTGVLQLLWLVTLMTLTAVVSAEEAEGQAVENEVSGNDEAPGQPSSEGEADIELARRLFEQGRQLIEREGGAEATVPASAWEAAFELFRQSYTVYPTPFALFNASTCLRVLERLPESAAGFEEYLERFDSELGEETRAMAERELARLRPQVARLIIAVEGAEAPAVTVDGIAVDVEGIARGLPIAPGRHSVEVRAPGYVPARREVTLSASHEHEVLISLQQLTTGLGIIIIEALVPNVSIVIDERQVGTTPLLNHAFVVPAGAHVVEATRVGYQPLRVETTVSVGASRNVSLEPRPLSELDESISGRVNVEVRERDAEVLLDGQSFAGGQLPIGPHRLEVRSEGFEPYTEDIEVTAGDTVTLDLALRPTAAFIERRRTVFRRAAYITGGASLAFLGTAVGLLIWNGQRLDDYEIERLALMDATAPDRSRRMAALNELWSSISTMNVVSWVLLGVGAIPLGVAVALFAAAPRSERARRISIRPQPGGLALALAWP